MFRKLTDFLFEESLDQETLLNSESTKEAQEENQRLYQELIDSNAGAYMDAYSSIENIFIGEDSSSNASKNKVIPAAFPKKPMLVQKQPELMQVEQVENVKKRSHASLPVNKDNKKSKTDKKERISLHTQEIVPEEAVLEVRHGLTYWKNQPVVTRRKYSQMILAQFFYSETCERAPAPSFEDQLAKVKYKSADGRRIITKETLLKREFCFIGTNKELTPTEKLKLQYRNGQLWLGDRPVYCKNRNYVQPTQPSQFLTDIHPDITQPQKNPLEQMKIGFLVQDFRKNYETAGYFGTNTNSQQQATRTQSKQSNIETTSKMVKPRYSNK